MSESSSKALDVDGVKRYRLFPSTRALVTIVFFGVAFMVMANLFSLNMAIACMVNSTLISDGSSNLSSNNSCLINSGADSNDYGGTYEWTRMQQSFVLSATSMGAVFVVFIAGYYTDKLGSRIIGIIALVAFTIAAVAIPSAAHVGWVPLFIVRIFQGLGIIAGFPVYLVLAGQWFPMHERGLLMSIGASGDQAGSVFSTLVMGYFCESKFGWEGYFYTLAIVNFLCLVAWIVVYRDHITDCWFLSEKEANYILRTRGPGRRKENKTATPWGKIMTSGVVWSMICAQLGTMYTFFFVGDYVPTYYKEVLGISVTSSALLSSLPSLLQLCGRVVAGPIADCLERCLSRDFTVKLMTAISGYVPSLFLIGASFFTCNTKYGAVGCFSLAYFFFGFAIAGFMRAPLLIAPPFTGAVCGLAQTAQFAMGLVVPYISGAIIGNGTLTMWNWAIYTAAIIGIVGTTVFVVFGSGEAQSWAQTEQDNPSTLQYGSLGSCENGRKGADMVETVADKIPF